MSDVINRLNAALEGRYQIHEELGEGGMATVYLARDLKHNRQVALKVLRPELAAVVGAERFLSEIETTANLQHPNILPLFDSGEADSFLFYVMPYVEGESLRERIQKEHQLPLDEALEIAEDVASALQYAHEQGVVHRDVKPANILLSRGKPLVADFGIALALSEAGSGRITETGLSLGTPHYMSPEQAAGERSLDKRSDVYAVGCVLYEMLTGQPPYGGPTAQAVLGRILTGDPTPPTELRKAIPANVEHAVLKALEKLPADRFETADAFVRALENPSFRHAGGAGAALSPSAAEVGRWRQIAVAAAGVTVLLSAALVWSLTSRGARSGEPSWQRIQLLDREAFGSGVGVVDIGMAISPDGRVIAVADTIEDAIFLKTPASPDPVLVPGTEGQGAYAPSFSPDGKWILYLASSDSSLKKVPRAGGASIELADSVVSGIGDATWLEDGSILFTALGWHLDRVSDQGGPVERIVDVSGTATFVTSVNPLPGSRGALLLLCDNQCINPEIRALDLETGETKVLMPGATGAWYARTGHVVFLRQDGGVVAAPFDPEGLEVTGPAIPVLDGVQTGGPIADLTLGADGTLLYRPGAGGGSAAPYRLVWVDREGNATPIDPEWEADFRDPALAHDDGRVAVSIGPGQEGDLYVKQLPQGPLTRLTNDQNWNRRPVWTPDGRSIVFQTSVMDQDSTLNQFFRIRRADASRPAQVFLDLDEPVHQVAWSRNGDALVYRLGSVGENANLWRARVDAASEEADSGLTALLTAEYDEKAPALSPDGRWLAYVSDESGTDEVEVRPFPNVTEARYQVSLQGGREPRWSPEGDELFYRALDQNHMVAARIQKEPDFQVIERSALFEFAPFFRVNNAHVSYDVTQDGQRFLMVQSVVAGRLTDQEEESPTVILVRNWLQELERQMKR